MMSQIFLMLWGLEAFKCGLEAFECGLEDFGVIWKLLVQFSSFWCDFQTFGVV